MTVKTAEFPQLEDNLRSYLVESFLNESDATLGDDEDLLTVLDSLQILRLVMELEAEYAIKVDNSELTPENLGSISKLAAFIARKQQ